MTGMETSSFVAFLRAVGLAIQEPLANFERVVQILIFKPFKVGDLIKGQELTGHVKNK
jgi:small conductance mechanosensitive channel